MTALERLRPGFLARARREKLLAALFLVVLALLWLGTVVTRARAASRELGVARRDAEGQGRWYADQTGIEARYQDAIARLSGTVLPTGEQAYAKIDEIVRRMFSAFSVTPPQRDRKEKLVFHTIAVSVRGAEWIPLRTFYREVAAALPTVILDEVSLKPTSRNQPNLLEARFVFVAIETLR